MCGMLGLCWDQKRARQTEAPKKMQHILIVDDDEDLRTLLAYVLQAEDYKPSTADSGKAMYVELKKRVPDLIVLDLNLPDESGLALARQIRARYDVPIIVLTASQDRDDLMAALELGVNDFVTKPFDPKELILRVRNVLRHVGRASTDRNPARATFDGWTLDFDAGALSDASGIEVPLTPSEYNLLCALVRAPNRVLSRDHLLDAVSSGDDAPLPRMIDVFISQLRKKIESDASSPHLIVTVKGKGYRFAGKLE